MEVILDGFKEKIGEEKIGEEEVTLRKYAKGELAPAGFPSSSSFLFHHGQARF